MTSSPAASAEMPTREVLREVADAIGMNAPHLADMLNAYADGDERVGHYIGLHNEWVCEGHHD